MVLIKLTSGSAVRSRSRAPPGAYPGRAVRHRAGSAPPPQRSSHRGASPACTTPRRPSPIPRRVRLQHHQESLDTQLRAMFPGHLDEVRLPMLEDLLNEPVFTAWAEWAREEGTLGPLVPPSWASAEARGAIEVAMGLQLGAHLSKHAGPQLVPPGSGPIEHLKAAIGVAAAAALPASRRVPAEPDLRFAAAALVADHDRLGDRRRQSIKAVRELAERCSRTSRVLARAQPGTVAAVAGDINVFMVAVLFIVMRWPDRWLPYRFITGFQVIGEVEHTGVFMPMPGAESESPESLLAGHEERLAPDAGRERGVPRSHFPPIWKFQQQLEV